MVDIDETILLKTILLFTTSRIVLRRLLTLKYNVFLYKSQLYINDSYVNGLIVVLSFTSLEVFGVSFQAFAFDVGCQAE